MKRILVLTLAFATLVFGQKFPKWDPNTTPLFDPCGVLSWDGREEVAKTIAEAPVKSYVIVLKDTDATCVGKRWARKIAKAKAKATDLTKFSPINVFLADTIQKKHIGEKDSKGQSMVLLATTIRGNPMLRWALSVSEPTHQKVHEPAFGNAFSEFAKAIAVQNDRKPAHGDKMADGIVAGLKGLYTMLQ